MSALRAGPNPNVRGRAVLAGLEIREPLRQLALEQFVTLQRRPRLVELPDEKLAEIPPASVAVPLPADGAVVPVFTLVSGGALLKFH